MSRSRRSFLTLVGTSAAAWPLAARAQQHKPVIGMLGPNSSSFASVVNRDAFLQALREHGYLEGSTVAFEYRAAMGQFDRIPELVADLVRRGTNVIVTGSPTGTRAVKAATMTVPIVFGMGEDPIREKIVESLGRPGANLTGYTDFTNQLVAKRLELLREVLPGGTEIGLLVNPANPNAEPDTKDVQAAADALGLRLQVLGASTDGELERAFASMAQRRIGALQVGVDPWFRERRQFMSTLAARHAVPAIYERRDFVDAGGLLSYGTTGEERGRQMGLYVARILKGAKPWELPVQQATRFEFHVNLSTAKALGLQMPTSILLRATEVIE